MQVMVYLYLLTTNKKIHRQTNMLITCSDCVAYF